MQIAIYAYLLEQSGIFGTRLRSCWLIQMQPVRFQVATQQIDLYFRGVVIMPHIIKVQRVSTFVMTSVLILNPLPSAPIQLQQQH